MRNSFGYLAALIVLGILAIFLWNRPLAPKPAGLETMRMRIGDQDFILEKAVTEPDQEKGLMDRPSLEADHGMLFVFSGMKERTFWNHHVQFPLDLIFLDAAGKVLSLKHMDAQNDAFVSSDVPTEYAIELNAGTAQRVGVRVGEQLDVRR